MCAPTSPAGAVRRLSRIAVGTCWIAVCAAGFAWFAAYDNTPGTARAVPSDWPAASQLQPSQSGATLVLFAHPHCPCTRATLGELEKLVAQVPEGTAIRVVFLKPSSMPNGWEQTDLWQTAAAIPGVQVVRDVDGTEAECFRATTSGHALLYDENQKLVFEGGITFARGHAGDNAGRSAIEQYLRNGSIADRCTPVFGCPIATPDVSQSNVLKDEVR